MKPDASDRIATGLEVHGLVGLTREAHTAFAAELEALCQRHGVLLEAYDAEVFDYDVFRAYCIQHGRYFHGFYQNVLGHKSRSPNEVQPPQAEGS